MGIRVVYGLRVVIGFCIVGTVVAELDILQGPAQQSGSLQEIVSDVLLETSVSGQNSTSETSSGIESITSGEAIFSDLLTLQEQVNTGITQLPSLKISEVFFDGSDEWIEVTNHGGESFSGSFVLSGNGVHASVTGFWTGQEVGIITRNTRTYSYILDASSIKNSIAMLLTDTKAISLEIWYQNQLLDSFFVDTGTVLHYNDKNTSLERNLDDGSITGTSLSRTRNVISGYLANPGHYITQEALQPPPQETGLYLSGHLSSTWRITEVYADPDSWIELTNIGVSPFSGIVTISGFSTANVHLPVHLLHGQSKVFVQQGSQIQDTGVIAISGIAWQHDPNKGLHIQAFDESGGQDDFIIDEWYIKKYRDYNISFEKVGEGNTWITTKTTLDRRFNNRVGFVVNPGKIYTTGENLEHIDLPPSIMTGDVGDIPIDCQSLSTDESVQISELFFGNDAYRSFIEIEVNDDIDLSNIVLSGSLLEEEIGRTIADDIPLGEKNTTRLISSDEDWYNKGLDALDNPRLSIKKTPGRLGLYVISGQNRQLMDIVYSPGGNTGQSLYYGGKTQSCGRIFDETGAFSPGFKKKFLDYFAVSTSPKIEYIEVGRAVAGSCPLLPQEEVLPQVVTGIQLTSLSGQWQIPQIDILSIDYDPPGNDTNQEKIELLLHTGSVLQEVFLGRKDRYLKINTTKKYLTGTLFPESPKTLQGTFGFPNSSKTGQAISVQLRYLTAMIAQYSYLPKVPAKTPSIKIKTGEVMDDVQLVQVIDGDTIKIAYQGKEQNVRFLGIDAPEISLLRTKKKGCFADEARVYLTSLLQGKRLRLTFDPSQAKTDAYKRRLVYVYADDLLTNEEMLSQGYAKEYTFKTPYQQRDVFLSAQQEAQTEQRGLWNPSLCPENVLGTGKKESTGELQNHLIQGNILALLPNPKGKDTKEGIRLIIHSLDTGSIEISGIYLNIKEKKKKLPSVIGDQETLLTGSFTLPNTATCIDLGYQDQTLDTLCYGKPKEDKRYSSEGEEATQLSDQEQNLLNALKLVKQGNQLCMFYKDLQIGCKTVPSGKTATKTKRENKLYEGFITIVDTYLKENWTELYYTPQLQTFFSLFRAAKKDISKGQQEIASSHGNVQVYDISQQLLLLQTYSLVYRAKVSAQIGTSFGTGNE